jgi:hypothetical protein
MFQRFRHPAIAPILALFASFTPTYAQANEPLTQNVVEPYSQLVDLAESANLVLRADILGAARVEPERAGKVGAGLARVYIEAHPSDAYAGILPPYPAVRYLADVPLDARGKLPVLKKRQVILLARPVPGSEGALQLVAPDGQKDWSPELEARLRGVLAELSAPDAPPRVTGINMALYQMGDLAGEGETQIFLNTASGAAAAIIVQHKAGQPAHWTASFSEVVNASGVAPARDTLAWYRLACSLPSTLPSAANVGETQEAQDQAQADYLLVLRDLGPCGRAAPQ